MFLDSQPPLHAGGRREQRLPAGRDNLIVRHKVQRLAEQPQRHHRRRAPPVPRGGRQREFAGRNDARRAAQMKEPEARGASALDFQSKQRRYQIAELGAAQHQGKAPRHRISQARCQQHVQQEQRQDRDAIQAVERRNTEGRGQTGSWAANVTAGRLPLQERRGPRGSPPAPTRAAVLPLIAAPDAVLPAETGWSPAAATMRT